MQSSSSKTSDQPLHQARSSATCHCWVHSSIILIRYIFQEVVVKRRRLMLLWQSEIVRSSSKIQESTHHSWSFQKVEQLTVQALSNSKKEHSSLRRLSDQCSWSITLTPSVLHLIPWKCFHWLSSIFHGLASLVKSTSCLISNQTNICSRPIRRRAKKDGNDMLGLWEIW